jgi:NADPH:quinone reductase-like Zn-dependent oxidoreductase
VVGNHSGGEYTVMSAPPPSTMRAVTIDAHGGLDRLRVRDDLPIPAPGPGEVRIRVHAASLNRLDLWVLGGIPGVTIRPPWIVGADLSGTVHDVGDDVHSVALGDRVMVNPGWVSDGSDPLDEPTHMAYGMLGEHRPGSLADYVCVPARSCRVIPVSVPTATAAASSLVGLTAWRMVVSRAQVRADDDVLIWGIGGGVSLAALSICTSLGAHVRVTSSSPAKLEQARRLGANVGLDHTNPLEVAKAIRAATEKRGVSVVIDSVGTKTWESSLLALGRRGRLVTCGGTSGALVSTDVRRMFWNQWTLMGSTMGNQAEFSAVVAAVVDGRLRVPIDREYPLEQAADGYARLASGEQFGKVVIRLAED